MKACEEFTTEKNSYDTIKKVNFSGKFNEIYNEDKLINKNSQPTNLSQDILKRSYPLSIKVINSIKEKFYENIKNNEFKQSTILEKFIKDNNDIYNNSIKD